MNLTSVFYTTIEYLYLTWTKLFTLVACLGTCAGIGMNIRDWTMDYWSNLNFKSKNGWINPRSVIK